MANACTFNFCNPKKITGDFIFKKDCNSPKLSLENVALEVLETYLVLMSRVFSQSNYDIINSKIDNVFLACNKRCWDNDNALPISSRAVSNAKKCISLIDKNISPDIIPFPTSDIGFSWKKDRNTLNIIFNDKNQIIYVISQNKKIVSGYFGLDNKMIIKGIVENFLNNE